MGFHYLGPNAGEVTQGFSVAMRKGATSSGRAGIEGPPAAASSSPPRPLRRRRRVRVVAAAASAATRFVFVAAASAPRHASNRRYSDFLSTVGIHPTIAEEFTGLTVTKSSGESAAKGGC